MEPVAAVVPVDVVPPAVVLAGGAASWDWPEPLASVAGADDEEEPDGAAAGWSAGLSAALSVALSAALSAALSEPDEPDEPAGGSSGAGFGRSDASTGKLWPGLSVADMTPPPWPRPRKCPIS